MKTSLRFLLLVALAAGLVHASSRVDKSRCDLTLNRRIGFGANIAWVCRCPDENGKPFTNGWAVIDPPRSEDDTAAQASATLRCIDSHTPRVLRVCSQTPDRFQKEALRVLKQCARATVTRHDLRMKGPFTFSEENCTAIFRPFASDTQAAAGGALLCTCIQKEGYIVTKGDGISFTDDAPGGKVEEVSFLESCTMKELEQISDVCVRTPKDVAVLSLQLLQVCCKRARVQFRNEKLQCAEIVPDDLTPRLLGL